MIRDLSIKNYRCFEDFKVDGLAQVNLIVGNNNSGKTSFLEAIYILLDKSYYYKFHNKITTLINSLKLRKEYLSLISEDSRESKTMKLYLIRHLFHKYQINKTIDIFCNNDFFRKVQITNLKLEKSKSKNLHLLTTDDECFKVNYEFKKSNTENKNTRGQAFYEINQQGTYIQETPENTNQTRLNGIERLILYTPDSIFMPLNYDYLDDIEKNWDLIQLTPKEDKVIEALKIINPDIERIGFTVSQYTKQIRLKIKGERQPIPLSSMGQGMNRILGLITTAVILENGVLLIDEIETGLHYEAQTDMWRLLIKTAEELNVQIFATTHSWDCICAYQEALEDMENQSVGKLFRLDDKYGKLRAVEYKADEISIAVDQGIEVR
ncbi:AAA family ATPase [Crocosphaera sp. Alani8]|uniref:AAA family ATPase n=1 Tax=Crocosphaera sp. Alani8 TaxID=3038952 RepID=UPI00313A782A